MLIDSLILLIDSLKEDIMILRKSLNPMLELLLSKGEQQFVHIVYTILQIRNSNHKAIP